MRAFCQYTCFLATFSLLCLSVTSYIAQDYQIQDLVEQVSDTNFAQEANQWTIVNQLLSDKYTVCSGNYVLGGYANLAPVASMKRSYKLSAPHNTLKISALFTIIDDWGPFDTVFFELLDSSGSTVYRTQILDFFDSAGLFNFSYVAGCGNNSLVNDLVDVYVQIEIPHTASTFEIVIQATNSNNGSLGLRDLNILFSNEAIPSPSYCFIDSPTLLNRLYPNHCYCIQQEYMYYSTSNLPVCGTCDPSCAACATNSANTSCISCKSNYYYNGKVCAPCNESSCETCNATKPSQCISCPNGYSISLNQTCTAITDCQNPLSIIPTNGVDYCKFPCPSDQFLFSNNTCGSSCPTPFTKLTIQYGSYCNFPCSPTQFYYADLTPSCQSSCTWPYYQVSQGGNLYNYCNRRCPTTSYLYWDNSCVSDCPLPLTSGTPQNTQVCLYTCNAGEYLYADKSCDVSCDLPFQITVIKEMNLCLVPCDPSQFVLSNGTCISSCPTPMVQVINAKGNFCNDPCPTVDLPYYYTEGKTCVGTCIYPFSSTDYGMYIACDSMSNNIETINRVNNVTEIVDIITLTLAEFLIADDAGSVSTSMLVKMVQYIQYLNISYPRRLELTFKSHNSTYGIYRIGPKIPTDVAEKFPLRSVPYRFLKFNVYSSFFVNFWDSLILLSIIFGLFLVIYLMECAVSTNIKRVRVALQNLFISQFYNVFGDVFLFFGLEARSLDLDSSGALISFSLGIVIVLIGVIVIWMHLRVLVKFHVFRKKKPFSWPQEINNFSDQFQGFGVFFKLFKNSTFIEQSFLLLFVLRNLAFNLTLALLTDFPLVQTIIIFCLTLFILIYTLINRSFRTLLNLLQYFLCEIITLIVNVCVLIMARLDSDGDDPNNAKETLGNIVIYSTLLMGFIPLIFLGWKLFLAIAEYLIKNKFTSTSRSNRSKNYRLRNESQNHQNTQNKSTIEDSSIDLGLMTRNNTTTGISNLNVDTHNKSNTGLSLISGLDDSPSFRVNWRIPHLMPEGDDVHADRVTMRERRQADVSQFHERYDSKDRRSRRRK